MDLDLDNEVHARILLSVKAIAEEEAQQLQMSISLPVLKAIGDMVVQYMEILARELEMFAQHAGRKSVNMDDVLLSARRNPDVAAKLMPVVQELVKTSKKNKGEKLQRKKEPKGKRKKQECDEAECTSPHREDAAGEASKSTDKRQKM